MFCGSIECTIVTTWAPSAWRFLRYPVQEADPRAVCEVDSTYKKLIIHHCDVFMVGLFDFLMFNMHDFDSRSRFDHMPCRKTNNEANTDQLSLSFC